jgi:hypothetical protein
VKISAGFFFLTYRKSWKMTENEAKLRIVDKVGLIDVKINFFVYQFIGSFIGISSGELKWKMKWQNKKGLVWSKVKFY